MEKITKEELKTILEQHKLWLNSNGKEGKCADLSDAYLNSANLTSVDLRRADLSDSDLRGADLSGANLSGANLTRANLIFTNLRCANLSSADLSGASLSGVDLIFANLICANLSSADLYYANLRCADLIDSDLSGANLSSADLSGADLTNTILDEKEQCRKGITLTEPMIGYKKAYCGKIITLEIPIGAKVFSINNNKRRTNKVKVINMQGETELISIHDNDFKYHVGDEIDIIDFDDNYNIECSTGIHFFLTREEAENF